MALLGSTYKTGPIRFSRLYLKAWAENRIIEVINMETAMVLININIYSYVVYRIIYRYIIYIYINYRIYIYSYILVKRNINHIYIYRRLNSLRHFYYNSHRIYRKKTIFDNFNFNLKIKTYGIIGYHSESTRVESIFRSPDFQRIALPDQSYNVMSCNPYR